jgi:hypothetical protein
MQAEQPALLARLAELEKLNATPATISQTTSGGGNNKRKERDDDGNDDDDDVVLIKTEKLSCSNALQKCETVGK